MPDNRPRVCAFTSGVLVVHSYWSNEQAERVTFLYPPSIWLRKGNQFIRRVNALNHSKHEGYCEFGMDIFGE